MAPSVPSFAFFFHGGAQRDRGSGAGEERRGSRVAPLVTVSSARVPNHVYSWLTSLIASAARRFAPSD